MFIHKRAAGFCAIAMIALASIAGCAPDPDTWVKAPQGDGYSFQVKQGWKSEQYKDNSYKYYLDGEDKTGETLVITEYELPSGKPLTTEAITQGFFGDMGAALDGGSIETKYSDVVPATFGGHDWVCGTVSITSASTATYSYLAVGNVTDDKYLNVSYLYDGEQPRHAEDVQTMLESITNE